MKQPSLPADSENAVAMIVTAHQDDEIASCFSIITHFKNVVIIHITNGAAPSLPDPAQYAKTRTEELKAAIEIAKRHAGKIALKSIGISDQAAIHNLNFIAGEINKLISAYKPDIIFTHPYEGGHPDHDSTCLAVHLALNDLTLKSKLPPRLFEFSSYFNDNGCMAVFRFLRYYRLLPAIRIKLSDTNIKLKRKMYNCFQSQQNVLQYFPIKTELFRPAPLYDFKKPPHNSPLYYDLFNWGIDSWNWQQIANEKLQKERIEVPI